MKKSMLNVITLALVLINLVLTVILTFSIVSTTKKTDNLITKVAEIIDLDVGGGLSSAKEDATLSVGDLETVDVKNSDDTTKITLSLLDSNNKIHYAQVSVVITLNKKSKDYSSKRASIDSGMQLIVNNVNSVVASYTYDTALQNKSNMEAELLSKLQNLFQTDMIHSVAINLVIS
ncbi:MAG: flagellar basal body-associated FliL family protein [Bacteroides sp.]|nr:flagellar basal body-associated FliL family protein [Clostridia bacterium]